MAKRSIIARLEDILQAIANINLIAARTDAEAFGSDTIARLAIERCLEIVSEASRHIPSQQTDRYPEVPWSNIRAIGNRLRHKYDQLDSLIIWNTATLSVPDLKPVIQAIMASVESEESD